MRFDLAELPLPQKSSSCSMSRPPAPAALDYPESPTKRFSGLNYYTASQDMGSSHPTSPCKSARRGVLTPLTRTRSSFAGFGSAILREPCWSSPSSRAGSPKKLVSSRSRITSEDVCDSLSVFGVSCRTPHASDASGSLLKASPSTSSSVNRAKPLPQADIDWLMSTLSEKEVSRFQHRYFVNDCKRRFGELDVHCTGLLGLEELKDALVEMFPTLKLELRKDGHHIPALDKSLPSLIATFDTDADGSLDFDDFMKFIQFQQAWREQFFLSRSLITNSLRLEPLCKSAEEISERPRSTASRGGRRKKPKGSRSEKGSSTSLQRPGSSSSISSSSTRASSRGTLDSSRGAFYSSMMGLSSPQLRKQLCVDFQ